MRSFRTIPALLLLILTILSCTKPDPDPLTQFQTRLEQIRSAGADRQEPSEQLWNSLSASDQIPFRSDSVVYFLYRGEAESVHWNGDFNSWGQDEEAAIVGERITGTNLWISRAVFPSDARLDYKITLNEQDWITDPANPHIQYSGFGPNSELRMPDYVEDPMVRIHPSAPSGTLSENKVIQSKSLGYKVMYRVYTPPAYHNDSELPVLFVTDGQEYSDPRLGALPRITNNLLHEGLIPPILIVFVSPLDPDDPAINRRTEEMGMNQSYLQFYTRELIPAITNDYAVSSKASDRGILGTSLGGLNATYFAFSRPDIFGMAGIQAPAYWYNEEIYDLVSNVRQKAPLVYLSTGTINDNLTDARKMRDLLRDKDISITYHEVNEGHSWGAWKTQLDEILQLFFGGSQDDI